MVNFEDPEEGRSIEEIFLEGEIEESFELNYDKVGIVPGKYGEGESFPPLKVLVGRIDEAIPDLLEPKIEMRTTLDPGDGAPVILYFVHTVEGKRQQEGHAAVPRRSWVYGDAYLDSEFIEELRELLRHAEWDLELSIQLAQGIDSGKIQ